jgi:hypothetical protein
MPLMARTIPFFIAVMLVFAIASAQQRPASPNPGPAARPVSVEVSNDFLIGPEDVLGVVFWRAPTSPCDRTDASHYR